MTAADWFALLGGLAAIAWVNWYFLFTARAVAAPVQRAPRADGRGPIEVPIVVSGGYEPAAVRLRTGERVRLVFDRRETSGCSEEVVIPDFGVRRYLPPFQRTSVELTPQRAGTYEFTCGMGMLRGTLVVE